MCLKEHVRVNRTQGSYGFLEKQAGLLKTELEEASTALRDAKNKHEIVTLDGRRASLQQQISTVDLQQQETKTAIAASQAKLDDMNRELENLPAHTIQQLAVRPTTA